MYSSSEKQAIIDSVKHPSHDYFSFFVCRNPLAKLVSVYKYQKDRTAESSKKGKDWKPWIIEGFPIGRPPSWNDYLTFDPFRSGLTKPLWNKCDPCHHHWDAVVKMETFNSDSKAILRASGSKVALSHLNNLGSAGGEAGVTNQMVWRLFGNASKAALTGIVEAYWRDFLMCGYDDTLETLKEVQQKAA